MITILLYLGAWLLANVALVGWLYWVAERPHRARIARRLKGLA